MNGFLMAKHFYRSQMLAAPKAVLWHQGRYPLNSYRNSLAGHLLLVAGAERESAISEEAIEFYESLGERGNAGNLRDSVSVGMGGMLNRIVHHPSIVPQGTESLTSGVGTCFITYGR